MLYFKTGTKVTRTQVLKYNPILNWPNKIYNDIGIVTNDFKKSNYVWVRFDNFEYVQSVSRSGLRLVVDLF